MTAPQRKLDQSAVSDCPVLQNVYVSVRRTQGGGYRIAGFEDSLDPALQDLYHDFNHRQANDILLQLGMSPSRADATLATAMKSTRACRFNIGLTASQSMLLKDALSDAPHVSTEETSDAPRPESA